MKYSSCWMEWRAQSKLEAVCVTSFSLCCFVAWIIYMADLHAENNITRLTKPFFSLDRTVARASLTHTYSTQSTLNQADMCSAQPVITRALMWSLGAAEASYYCRFMTTLTQTLHPTVPPLFPPLAPITQSHIHLSACCNSQDSHASWQIWETWKIMQMQCKSKIQIV